MLNIEKRSSCGCVLEYVESSGTNVFVDPFYSSFVSGKTEIEI